MLFTVFSCSSVFALALCSLPSGTFAQQSFRGAGNERQLAVQELDRSLQEFLDAAHQGGNSPKARSLAKIEGSIARTFQALPKNAMGRLAPRSVRYLVHSYFAKEHGWQIKGLEPQGMRTNVSEVHDVGILQDKAPAFVEALLESHQSDRGLALADLGAMIAMLERLILDESAHLLRASYFLNSISEEGDIDEEMLHEVLRSYLLLVEMGMRSNFSDVERHQKIKSKVAAVGSGWSAIVEFESDAVVTYVYQTRDSTNPFLNRAFTFGATRHVVEDLAEGYGQWQNDECSRMKQALIERDTQGTGLIPLSVFYAKSSTRDYQFTESIDYLRQIGAVDETTPVEPSVRLANYVTGPSNCIASSTYYSICCLTECDHLLNELEGSIQAPSANPERIFTLVSKLTTSSMLEPVALSAGLASKLQDIAARNNGEVPLHGRLFAQWLHLAFPYECPFPHVFEEADTLAADHWVGGKAIASAEERDGHVEAVQALQDVAALQDVEVPLETAVVSQPTEAMWSDEEILPLSERPRPAAFGYVRIAVQLALFLVVLRIAFTAVSAAVNMGGKGSAKKSTTLSELPF